MRVVFQLGLLGLMTGCISRHPVLEREEAGAAGAQGDHGPPETDAGFTDVGAPEAGSPEAPRPVGRPIGPNLTVVCDPAVSAIAWWMDNGGVGIWPRTYGCDLEVTDRHEVFLWAEAGRIDPMVSLDATGRGHAEGLAELNKPWDVEPLPYEVALGFPWPGGHNPRDGAVRVVAWVDGPEPFMDVNGDGRFEAAQGDYQTPEQDLSEPLLDANDDGQWTRGEWYRDLNGNHRFDGPDGQWSPTGGAWTSTLVLWTGPLEPPGLTLRCTPACSTGDTLPTDHRCAGADWVLPPGALDVELEVAATDKKGNCMGDGVPFVIRRSSDQARVEGVVDRAHCYAPEGPVAQPLRATFPYPDGLVDDRVTVELVYVDAFAGEVPRSKRWRICR